MYAIHTRARLLVFKGTFVQTVFAVLSCAVVEVSLLYTLVITCSLIFSQL